VLRDLGPRDGPRLFELTRVSFPEESAILGFRSEAMEKVLRRIFRPDLRLLLGIARLIGRPIFRYFVIEEEGRIVAGTLLTFTARTGYVSNVTVDPSYRRRGFARRLLQRAHEETARRHRSYLTLDVLTTNAPAIALYRSLGYERLRTMRMYRRSLTPLAAPATPAPRSYRPADRPALLEADAAQIPPEVAEVLPPGPGEFGGSSFVDSLLSAHSHPTVVELGGRPSAYLHTSASATQTSANLRLVVAPSVTPDELLPGIAEAIAWAKAEGAEQMVVYLPDYKSAAVAAIRSAGFEPIFELTTMVRTALA
jgi:GNAT superfamily N-acetyltransferase